MKRSLVQKVPLLLLSLFIVLIAAPAGTADAQSQQTLPSPTITSVKKGSCVQLRQVGWCEVTVSWSAIKWPTPVTYKVEYYYDVSDYKIKLGQGKGWSEVCKVTNGTSCSGRVARNYQVSKIKVTASATDPSSNKSTTSESVTGAPSGLDNPDCGCGTWAANVAKNGVAAGSVQKAICEAVCSVNLALGRIVEIIMERFVDVTGISIDQKFIRKLASTCWIKQI